MNKILNVLKEKRIQDYYPYFYCKEQFGEYDLDYHLKHWRKLRAIEVKSMYENMEESVKLKYGKYPWVGDGIINKSVALKFRLAEHKDRHADVNGVSGEYITKQKLWN